MHVVSPQHPLEVLLGYDFGAFLVLKGLRTPEIAAPSILSKNLYIATPGLGKTFPMNGTYRSGLHNHIR